MPQRRIEYLDGIRAIAILSVVAVHWLPQYMPKWLPVFQGGYVGVDLFLILSGYLITRILWRSPEDALGATYRAFLWRRVLRLYPALLGILATVTALSWLLGQPAGIGAVAGRALVSALQLTPIVTALQLDSMIPFEHTWTLGWEWYFYLLWPLLVLALRRRVTAMQAAELSVAAAMVLGVLSVVLMPAPLVYNGPLGRFAELLLGSAVGLYFLARPEPMRFSPLVRTSAMVAAVAVVGGWTVFGSHQHSPLYGLLGFPLTAFAGVVLIGLGYGHEADPIPRLLGWAPLRSIGVWSYSIYLWHLAPLQLLTGHMFGLPSVALGVLGVGATVVCSWASYRFLEKPFLSGREPARGAQPVRAGTSAR